VKKAPPGNSSATGTHKMWHAVSVACGISVCEAALKVRQVRFLSREAPLLPLPDCTAPAGCRCTYKHHPDRRTGPRRMTDRPAAGRAPSVRASGEERRRPGRRRDTDL
jgi:hypothetical protein